MSPGLTRVMSWNVAEYVRPGPAEQRAPYIEKAIHEIGPQILLVQELYAETPEEAGRRAQQLATATGLTCRLPDGGAAVAFGGHDMHCAVLWDPQAVSPGTGRWRTYGAPEMWHAFLVGDLIVDGVEITVGSYQAPSLARNRRADEAERLMLAALSDWTKDTLIFGCDANSLSNARTPDGQFYDRDPYRGVPPQPAHVSQIHYIDEPDGSRGVRADRRPAETLSHGGLLHDAAAALGGPSLPTIGHQRPDGPHGKRRIDLQWVTTALLPAVRSCAPVNTLLTQTASDHLPVVTELELRALRTE